LPFSLPGDECSSRPPLSPRFDNERGFALQPQPFANGERVVAPARVAAAMGQAQVFEEVGASRRGRTDPLDLRRKHVARREVELDRPPATRAIVAVAPAKGGQALLPAFALGAPGVQKPDKRSCRHRLKLSRWG
jgi:hypothetical protein